MTAPLMRAAFRRRFGCCQHNCDAVDKILMLSTHTIGESGAWIGAEGATSRLTRSAGGAVLAGGAGWGRPRRRGAARGWGGRREERLRCQRWRAENPANGFETRPNRPAWLGAAGAGGGVRLHRERQQQRPVAADRGLTQAESSFAAGDLECGSARAIPSQTPTRSFRRGQLEKTATRSRSSGQGQQLRIMAFCRSGAGCTQGGAGSLRVCAESVRDVRGESAGRVRGVCGVCAGANRRPPWNAPAARPEWADRAVGGQRTDLDIGRVVDPTGDGV